MTRGSGVDAFEDAVHHRTSFSGTGLSQSLEIPAPRRSKAWKPLSPHCHQKYSYMFMRNAFGFRKMTGRPVWRALSGPWAFMLE